MNKAILTTLKKELKTILRDKRSLVMMLLTPLMIPAFIIFFSYLYNEMINNTETYKVGINYSLNSVEQSIIDELPLEIIYKNEDELSKSYKDKEISLKSIENEENDLIPSYKYLNEKPKKIIPMNNYNTNIGRRSPMSNRIIKYIDVNKNKSKYNNLRYLNQ